MSILELHPDDLIDKAARGPLTEDEEVRLQEHLARCAACRLERSVALDFRAELAEGEGDLELESLVTRALSGAQMAPETTAMHNEEPAKEDELEESPKVTPISRGRRRRFSPMLIAAACAVFSVVGIAAAAEWTGVWQHGKSEGAASTGGVVNKVSSAPVAPSSAVPSPPSSIVGTATQEEPAASAQLAEETPPSSTAIPAKSTMVPHVHSAPIAEAPAPKLEEPVVLAPATAPPETAAMLFADANRARVRGQHADAVRGYRDLLQKYPTAAEAKLAEAIIGRILLDDGNAKDALVSLDRYLASGDGSLREEALAAKATALGRLGRADEEVATWSALLKSYPHSIHAKRAEARINEASSR